MNLSVKLELFFFWRGRINRATYWAATTACLAVWWLLEFVGVMLAGAGAPIFILWGLWLPQVLLAIPLSFIGIKRLHDRDTSGWWLLVFLGLPAVLNFSSRASVAIDLGVPTLALIASLPFWIWGVIEMGFLPGIRAENINERRLKGPLWEQTDFRILGIALASILGLAASGLYGLLIGQEEIAIVLLVSAGAGSVSGTIFGPLFFFSEKLQKL